ncbi:MAG: phenylalanine--tRNA ligase subunit alpha [Chloroflexi bacterium RBG_13_51_36]|nr:MAG: phenylalanine--tRNA ligase subunit alpha [Chloroflexi bacterium RBG_13_51_36]
MLEHLKDLHAQALEELNRIDNPRELELWRVQYLGKKSSLTQSLRSLAALPLEERREVGAQANEIKTALESILAEKQRLLQETFLSSSRESGTLDVTLPGRPLPTGRTHPTTQILEEICDAFKSMGFQVIEGPDVEWDYYNFEALNMPQHHPARDMMATFWVDTGVSGKARLLRTHTSPMQIRLMEKERPPIRAIVPGRVYRYEATDATHESMFYQVEGLAVDKGITLADLKGTLFDFCRCIFGEERKVRFRCDYFPFVEPGVEVAISCLACSGTGCRLCGNSGWIEILGAGMVHPDVLARVDIDPGIYSGFAFGMGVERIPMLRYGIDDIRLFYGNDLRFLRQF